MIGDWDSNRRSRGGRTFLQPAPTGKVGWPGGKQAEPKAASLSDNRAADHAGRLLRSPANRHPVGSEPVGEIRDGNTRHDQHPADQGQQTTIARVTSASGQPDQSFSDHRADPAGYSEPSLPVTGKAATPSPSRRSVGREEYDRRNPALDDAVVGTPQDPPEKFPLNPLPPMGAISHPIGEFPYSHGDISALRCIAISPYSACGNCVGRTVR